MSEAELGLASEIWKARLAGRAAIERITDTPWYPAISCAHLECDNLAREGWYFCSRECRDAFVSEWLNETE